MHDATDDASSDQPMMDLGIWDAYETLGVARGSGDGAIASAYRTLARQFHPDIAGDAATTKMTRINAAFDAIKTAEVHGHGPKSVTGQAARGRLRVDRRAAFSISGVTSAGPSARSPAGIRGTWSGCANAARAARTSTRSTPPFARPACRCREPASQRRGPARPPGSTGSAEASRSGRTVRRGSDRPLSPTRRRM
jgi:hypothetical protein